jgi:NAD-dependent deacetylase
MRPEDTRAAERAALESDLVIALGSSLSVYPAASLPLLAAERGTPYIVINRGPTEHDSSPLVTLRLEGDVVDILPPAVKDALSG